MDIKIDPDQLTLGDLEFFERAQTGTLKISDLVGVLARLTGTSEDVVRALNLKEFRGLMTQLQIALKEAGVSGEPSGGNSTVTFGRERGRRQYST